MLVNPGRYQCLPNSVHKQPMLVLDTQNMTYNCIENCSASRHLIPVPAFFPGGALSQLADCSSLPCRVKCSPQEGLQGCEQQIALLEAPVVEPRLGGGVLAAGGSFRAPDQRLPRLCAATSNMFSSQCSDTRLHAFWDVMINHLVAVA